MGKEKDKALAYFKDDGLLIIGDSPLVRMALVGEFQKRMSARDVIALNNRVSQHYQNPTQNPEEKTEEYR